MSGFGSVVNGSNVVVTSIKASLSLPVRTITGSTSVLTTDGAVLISGSNVTAFLPNPSTVGAGKTFFISNITTNTNNRVSSSVGNLNGLTTAITLTSRLTSGSGYVFVSDGTDWWLLAN